MPKLCNNCQSANIENRIFDIDGQNLVEDFTCLDCHNYYRNQPPIVEYEYLTADQINFITKHYDNQETADDVQELLVLAREVGLDITFELVTFEDCTADLVIKREDGQIKYFGDLCSSPLWLSKHIQAFGGGLDIALQILDGVLGWIKEGEKEELNAQVLKANYLLDLLLNKTSNYYLEDERIRYNYEAQKHLDLEDRENPQIMLVIYNQMLTEVTDEELQEIIKVSFDHDKKYELQLLNLLN